MSPGITADFAQPKQDFWACMQTVIAAGAEVLMCNKLSYHGLVKPLRKSPR